MAVDVIQIHCSQGRNIVHPHREQYQFGRILPRQTPHVKEPPIVLGATLCPRLRMRVSLEMDKPGVGSRGCCPLEGLVYPAVHLFVLRLSVPRLGTSMKKSYGQGPMLMNTILSSNLPWRVEVLAQDQPRSQIRNSQDLARCSPPPSSHPARLLQTRTGRKCPMTHYVINQFAEEFSTS